MRSSVIILVCALAQENIVLAQEDDSWQLDFESYPSAKTSAGPRAKKRSKSVGAPRQAPLHV